MAYAARGPAGTPFGRPTSRRSSDTPGLAGLFLLFLIGGVLVARAALEAPVQEIASLGPLARLAAARAPERPRQGAMPQAGAPVVEAPFCGPGQAPQFLLGFAALKSAVGERMGEPLECEHLSPEDGRTLQRTSTGLAVYDRRTNQAAFTEGWRIWALTPGGLVASDGGRANPTPARQ